MEGVDGENADAGVVGDIKDLLLGEGDVVGVMLCNQFELCFKIPEVGDFVHLEYSIPSLASRIMESMVISRVTTFISNISGATAVGFTAVRDNQREFETDEGKLFNSPTKWPDNFSPLGTKSGSR